MGMMQKLGGRKFLMAVVTILAAILLEIKSEKGLTPTMAGFLVAIVSAFSAVNVMATGKYLESESGSPSDSSAVTGKLDRIENIVQQNGFSPEIKSSLLNVLGNMQNDLTQLKETSGQIGKAMVNNTRDIQYIKSKG